MNKYVAWRTNQRFNTNHALNHVLYLSVINNMYNTHCMHHRLTFPFVYFHRSSMKLMQHRLMINGKS